MPVSLNPEALRKTKWYEYGVRFLFGGAITVIAALIAKQFGPAIGGLFLAFPAIFPASTTLLEKHERDKKKTAGITQTIRGRQAAAVDAYGAGLGSIGLWSFAVVVWRFLPTYNVVLVLTAATTSWLLVSLLLWKLRKSV